MRPSPKSAAPTAVHPRMGGEHAPRAIATLSPRGSSPHGRGTFNPCRIGLVADRFIPAWAGNIALMNALNVGRSVHPRMGGEHSVMQRRCTPFFGSSPHGRGTYGLSGRGNGHIRFIPAWAGNISAATRRGIAAPVHPRMGGEHARSANSGCYTDGSSPHGRGTCLRAARRALRGRFIPAWAGNIRTCRICSRRSTVHPRMGGEHTYALTLAASGTGSSPHGRGTSEPCGAAYRCRRFIPAWAGNIR